MYIQYDLNCVKTNTYTEIRNKNINISFLCVGEICLLLYSCIFQTIYNKYITTAIFLITKSVNNGDYNTEGHNYIPYHFPSKDLKVVY